MVATAALVTHVDGYAATRQEVCKIKPPKPTDTWHPISHGTLLDILEDQMKVHKIRIAAGKYALAKEGKQMFATFDLRSEKRDDFTLALGVRNSIDKSLSAGICCGSRVFVCDNLAFSSEIVFFRRHHANIMDVLPGTIDQALDRFTKDGDAQEVLYERMKKVQISLETGIRLICKMGEEEKVLPSPQLHKVIREFAEPRFKEFEGRNAWTLMNACTTFCRHDRTAIDPLKAQDNLLGITKVITEHCGLTLSMN